MQIGMIGLGKMGANMVRRLIGGGHGCVVFDHDPDSVAKLTREGAAGANTLAELVLTLKKPRVVWIMLPAGEPTTGTIIQLGSLLESGDIVVDGGNSYYKDDAARTTLLAEKGIGYVDVGTSGGIWGLENGYCLMIGGKQDDVQYLEPIFQTLSSSGTYPAAAGNPENKETAKYGYLHCGPSGAGHFVKMIHNGIEYGLMQAYAEGFDILKNAEQESLPREYRYSFNLAAIAEVWRHGSVIQSWLLDLAAGALSENPTLTNYTGFVQDSGEGRWTVTAALEEAVPADVLSAALYTRFRSRITHTFAEKMLSAMRHQFGGHVEGSGDNPAE